MNIVNQERMLQVAIESRSIKGSKGHNEDGMLVCYPSELSMVVAVADGLGGHGGGWKASRVALLAIEKAIEFGDLNDAVILEDLFRIANDAVLNSKAEYAHMRTTLVLLHVCLRTSTATWAHCGDSRLYHFNSREMQSVTKDHTVAQMLVAGKEIRRQEINSHPERNKLTRALGSSSGESNARYLKKAIKLSSQDQFLICTDGWWEYLLDHEIIECLPKVSNASNISEWIDNMDLLITNRQSLDVDDRSVVTVSFVRQ